MDGGRLMRCLPTTFLLSLLEWEDISPNFTSTSFRGLNLATDILLEEKLLVLMELVETVDMGEVGEVGESVEVGEAFT